MAMIKFDCILENKKFKDLTDKEQLIHVPICFEIMDVESFRPFISEHNEDDGSTFITMRSGSEICLAMKFQEFCALYEKHHKIEKAA